MPNIAVVEPQSRGGYIPALIWIVLFLQQPSDRLRCCDITYSAVAVTEPTNMSYGVYIPGLRSEVDDMVTMSINVDQAR